MSHMLSRDELLGVVVADLRYIRNEWGDDISDDALRRGSASLRLLLVQNELQRAWKAAGFEREPSITCAGLFGFPVENFKFWSAGGARCNGIEIQSVFEPRTRQLGQEMSAKILETLNSGTHRELVKLSQFTAAPCLIDGGVPVSRRTLIKYIANKLGGTHLDSKRDEPEGPLFRILDRLRAERVQADKPVIYFELLAIGQALAASPDMLNLMETHA